MSFGGVSEGSRSGALPYGNASMTAGEISSPHLVSFSSPGLSLGLQSNRDRKIHMRRMMAGGGCGSESGSARRNKELDENDSRSGSDNQEAVSGDDIDQDHNPRKKNKKYHRHTPQQIQELESLFKECPHPDEKQRLELSQRLNLESRQVKFWFQNRRTQMKTQIERHENSILRQENDKLRAENMTIREAMRNPICNNCGGPAMLGEISIEEQHLRVENARLMEELDRICALGGKFLGRSMSSLASSIAPPLPSSLLELGVGSNGGFTGQPPSVVVAPTISAVPDLFPPMGPNPLTPERGLLLELALAAMEELASMAQMEEPLWIPTADGSGGGSQTLNYEQYNQSFRRIPGIPSSGYVLEVSRDAGVVMIDGLALVETLMDANRWAEMFPNIIARATTREIISGGVGGSRNGALQLMNAELQVLSPLVAIRKVNFLRFCKQHAEGIWAVVDVSIDFISRESSLCPSNSYFNCRVLPSGCVVQDMANGYSKVTWIEHAEFDELQVHQLFRPLLRSGIAFGAGRWLATLRRQCECLAFLMSPSVSIHDDSPSGITGSGRRSMVKLAQRMTNAFCRGVCAAAAASAAGQEWSRLDSAGVGDDVRVLTRKSRVRDPGEPAGIVLSAATSVWVPAPPKRLFDFLRDAASRCKWDILYSVGPMLEMARVAMGQDSGNAVSLLRAAAASPNQAGMLLLQETCVDASGATVVYAPVDGPAMHVVMNGGDSSYVSVLPSGFAVHPDGVGASAASLLTVVFQILVDGQPPEDSVDTVNSLISRTIQKIKTALHYDDQ